MKKSLFLLLALSGLAFMLSGCSEPMIAAFGSNSEIVIVTTPKSSDEGEILKSILEREILTVQYERAFQVRLVTTGDVRGERNRKNIILLDCMEPPSNVSDAMLKLAGRDKAALGAGSLNTKSIQDRWAKGQVLMLIAAPGKRELEDLLAQQPDGIFSFVEEAVQARLNRSLFYAGEQTAASERLAQQYGWSLRLPNGYKVDETYANQRVIKIIQDKPARMITVYWEGGRWEERSAVCLERKKMLAWEFWDQDEIVEEALKIEQGSFLGHDSVVLSGTWENKKYTIGGVFASYCFTCDQCGQNYLIDAAVFAPGLDKLPLLRELEAILVTFTCCESTPKDRY
jgi:hypothetical protein